MSSYSDFFGGQPPKWISGTTYAVDQMVRSPANQHLYVRLIAGAGTTDPSADATNWGLVGAGAIKSIQRGVIAMGSNLSVSATISTVNLQKAEEVHLGVDSNQGGTQPLTGSDAVKLVLTASAITATRISNDGSSPNVSWRVTERV